MHCYIDENAVYLGRAQGRQKVLLFLVLTIQMVSTPWEKSCRLQDGASHFIAFKFRNYNAKS
jgi:hypothetical protein